MKRRPTSQGCFLVLAAALSALAGSWALAQGNARDLAGVAAGLSLETKSSASVMPDQLPEAPGQSASDPQAAGSIYGTVTDPTGNVIAGASVSLEAEKNKTRQTVITDSDGFFRFVGVSAGSFRVSVAAKGFATWTDAEIVLSAGQYYDVPDVSLQVAPTNTDVQVVLTLHDVAEEQIREQEQQRIFGVFPNFYTSYVWHAVPLAAGQKYRLALRTSIDPVTFAVDATTAGIEQATNAFSGYGPGAEGYAKRFGAVYGDDVIETMIGSAILPSVLHQDPRYFYRGTGSVSSRALYAISTVVIARGDDGRRMPNYSNVLGNLAAAGISNLYYPASDRNSASVTVENALIGTAEGTISALLQEFFLKKLSRGVQKGPVGQP